MDDSAVTRERAQNLWTSFARKIEPVAQATRIETAPDFGLSEIGAEAVLATAVVGSIEPVWNEGTMAVVTDYLNFTSGRRDTFHDGGAEALAVELDRAEPPVATGVTASLAGFRKRHRGVRHVDDALAGNVFDPPFGADERVAIRQQSEVYFRAVKAQGHTAVFYEWPGLNHFSVLDACAKPTDRVFGDLQKFVFS